MNTYGHIHIPTHTHTCSCTLIHSDTLHSYTYTQHTPQSGTGLHTLTHTHIFTHACTYLHILIHILLHTHLDTYTFTTHAHFGHTHTKDPSHSLMGALNISPFQVMMEKLPYPSLPFIPLQRLPGSQVSATFTDQVLMVNTLPWAR